MNLLGAIVAKYRRILEISDCGESFFAKIQILNAWRTVPYIDVEEILDEYEVSGIPMMLQANTLVPGGYDPDSFAQIPKSEVQALGGTMEDQKNASYIIQGMKILAYISTAFGVPIYLEGKTEGQESVIDYSLLKDAGLRASNASST